MIRSEQLGPVGLLALARPDRRNALTPEMLHRISTAAIDLAATSRAIVLAGDGPVFCAGFDLSLCRDDPAGDVMRALLSGLSAAIRTLRSVGVPVLAAAHGAAIAGGCALLGGCDLVVTDRSAKLGYPVVRLGVSPAVSAPFLSQGVGWGAARARLLDPGLISGQVALQKGLAHECTELPEQVLPRTMTLAQQLAAFPASGLAPTKRWLAEVAPVMDAERALEVSLSLAGGTEEAALLPAAWSKGKP